MKAGSAQKTDVWIAILDAGSQFGGLIDRTVRELGYRTALLPVDISATQLSHYSAIIISGGPKSLAEADAYLCDPELIRLGKPILGICYGLHLLTVLHGGSVVAHELREDGPQTITVDSRSKLFAGLDGQQKVLMSHGISVGSVPAGWHISGQSGQLIAAMERPELKQYAVQFHPEVFQTEHGKTMFRNFLTGIADLQPDYQLADQQTEAIQQIKQVVGCREVVIFVSGGVDSAVLAALMAKALPPKQLHAFHIDTGLMRAGESQAVIRALKAAGIDVVLLDKSKVFLQATTTINGRPTPPLIEVTDPQIKRQIIGDTFIKVRQQILKDYQIPADSVLAQGSLRPDLIESGSLLASSKADTIKTHHNDTAAVRALRKRQQVVEPLQELYKDQVRALGRQLGLPPALVDRHPFPGPGLAIRVICADVPYRLSDHEKLQQQLDELLAAQGFSDHTAHLLPIRTVGVQGDGRSYKYLAGVSGPADWQRLQRLAALIPNYHHAVNRVAYIFGDPINRQSLGITPTRLTPDSLDQLRQADNLVTSALRRHHLLQKISQLPVVLTPIDFGAQGQRSIALRPFLTPDFMTGIPLIPGLDLPAKVFEDLAKQIPAEVAGISRVMIDITSKPPATTEWE